MTVILAIFALAPFARRDVQSRRRASACRAGMNIIAARSRYLEKPRHMEKAKSRSKVTPVRMQGPQPASLCSVEIVKYVRAFDGVDKPSGRATGFHFRDRDGQVWLVTNWHALTGRRPDNPSALIGQALSSPTSIRVTYQSKTAGQFLQPLKLSLYDGSGSPIWFELKRERGIDLAAIPINLPEDVECPCVQDFANRDTGLFVPGLDLTIVGMALPHGVDSPYPIWKSARVASEPSYLMMGVPQVLIDTAGVPGMSGSPVYRLSRGTTLAFQDGKPAPRLGTAGEGGALDFITSLDLSKMQEINVLNFVGVYAGSTGQRDLDNLSLGRIFIASMVDSLIAERNPGFNPFPPDLGNETRN